MKNSNTAFIGLDVHKNSIDIAIAESGRTGEVRHYGAVGGDLDSLGKAVRKLRSCHAILHFAYEAGPCGYEVYRYLHGQGLDCVVIAPSLIPKRAGDRIKTDRRDALQLARMHRAGELIPIYVPRLEDEAIRDLVRCREDARIARHKSRQQLKALLLRNGIRYEGKSSWIPKHLRWLSELKLPLAAQQIAFQEYLDAVSVASERVSRLEQQIRAQVESWRMKPLVESAWAYRFPPRVSRIIRLRQENLPQKINDISWQAQLRLCSRYRRLMANGKCKQQTVTAIARELLGYLWAIAKEVKVA